MTGVQRLAKACLFVLAARTVLGAPQITNITKSGVLAWTDASAPGVCIIEEADYLSGPWNAVLNVFATQSSGQAALPVGAKPGFMRLLSMEISPTTTGFQNLLRSYGIIKTVAGKGEISADKVNNWLPENEGGKATDANLSRPHFAMADHAGNIYIADKDSHSILKVTPDGAIHTVAGTHEGGFNGDGPAPATSLQLNFPNGEWVRPDGTVYILDTDNGKVRRLGTDGMMQTLFTVKDGIEIGRGLWVADDESLIYFASGTDLKQWTPKDGVKTLNNNFSEIGNLVVDSSGQLLVTDRGANKVYLIDTTGKNVGDRSTFAGDGSNDPTEDGAKAKDTGLYGVRGIWPVPTGGYLLATHEGSQVLYLDASGIIHVFVDGAPGGLHNGDGDYFHTDGPKVSEVRSVTMDDRGNIILTENDVGYVRVINFLSVQP